MLVYREEREEQQEELKGQCYKCGKIGHVSKDCRSEEVGTDGMIRNDFFLNALEIGSVQLPKEDHRIRIRVDSCAAVTAFPKCVADDYPRVHTPGKAKSYRPASGKASARSGCAKGASKLKDWSLRYVNPRNCGQAQSFDGSVRN